MKLAIELDECDQISAGILRFGKGLELAVQQPEPLEEQLADQAPLVAEQLVDRGRRGLRLAGDAPCREAGDPFPREQPDRDREHVIAQLRRSLLASRHARA